MADDDLVMESTTDSPEQIAHGLGIDEQIDAMPVETADGEAEPIAEGDPEPEPEAAPIGEVTAHPSRQAAPRNPAKAKRLAPRNINGAVAAVRREEEAKRKVAETERDAALARVAELTTGIARTSAAAAPSRQAVKPVVADDIPDTHPAIKVLTDKITALGAKPKQGDFADFDEFEEKRDTWIEERARLRARVDSVREDVARRETLANDEAQRAAEQTTNAFQAAEGKARTRHADYDEQIEKAKTDGVRVSDDIVTALLESAHGGELRYYLCANRAEVDRLNKLSPHRQIAELGMIESRIIASLPTEPRGGRPAARSTKAPEPQENLIGDLSVPPTFKSREEEMNDPRTTQARYNKLRNEMDAESGRRLVHLH